jgi:hypothetical protein
MSGRQPQRRPQNPGICNEMSHHITHAEFKFRSGYILFVIAGTKCPHFGVAICEARLSSILASDRKCISEDPLRPADTVRLALLVLYGIIRCVTFFRGLQAQ